MMNPSRRTSNGRDTPISDVAPIAANPARARPVKAASDPPQTTASASPAWIIRTPVPIAWAPAAHAEATP